MITRLDLILESADGIAKILFTVCKGYKCTLNIAGSLGSGKAFFLINAEFTEHRYLYFGHNDRAILVVAVELWRYLPAIALDTE